MKRFAAFRHLLTRNTVYIISALTGLSLLYVYKLGSVPNGLTGQEITSSVKPVGWHGLLADPFYLPLGLMRSLVFYLYPNHGQFLTRLPNVPFGILAVVAIFVLVRWWFGTRNALISGVLFACTAWGLHVSRLATSDVLYYTALPVLFLSHAALKKYNSRLLIVLAILLTWLVLLYTPGIVYFVLIAVIISRDHLRRAWNNSNISVRLMNCLLIVLGLAPLIRHLIRPGSLQTWLGLPEKWPNTLHLGKQFVAVWVHLFFRGPQYPQIWLGKAPVLDFFSLGLCLLGLYFYVTHLGAFRSRLLLGSLVLGGILVSLGGAVSLSLLVPLLYIFIATGLAYLLREWLHTFPLNPIARVFGIGLVGVAVSLSCIYNIRAYYIAWPHASATRQAFRYHR